MSDKSEDAYTLALKAYALALAEAPEAAQVVVQLRAMATESADGMYWEIPPVNGMFAAPVYRDVVLLIHFLCAFVPVFWLILGTFMELAN